MNIDVCDLNSDGTMREEAMHAFWHQPSAERTLRQAARAGRLSRAFLFAGPEGVGKWPAALWVAQSLLCRERQDGVPCGHCRDCTRVAALTHPDLHLLYPVPSKTADEAAEDFLKAKAADPYAVVRYSKRPYITLERIRELIGELNKTSVEGGAKVVIIHSAEQTANDDCQSVMLKTIEEPPPGANFILTSAASERLLPTIHSRCQTVRFIPVDPAAIASRLVAELGVTPDEAEEIARLCGGWGNAVRLASEEHRAWREVVAHFWEGAFRVRPHELLAQIDAVFRPGGKRTIGFDALLEAFDVWSLCLWRDCLRLAAPSDSPGAGAPIPDPETGWACWRILQNGRATLYVNVMDRHAVAGMFLAMRRRLRIA